MSGNDDLTQAVTWTACLTISRRHSQDVSPQPQEPFGLPLRSATPDACSVACWPTTASSSRPSRSRLVDPHPPWRTGLVFSVYLKRTFSPNAVPGIAGNLSRSFALNGKDSLVLATSFPKNTPITWLSAISVGLSNGPPPISLSDQDDNNSFVHKQGQMLKTVVLHPAPQGNWSVNVSSQGQFPFSVNFAVYHPQEKREASPIIRPTFRCSACQMLAKALGVTIVTGISLATLPASLIATVAMVLGWTADLAAQFVNSLVGDSVESITKKLCVAMHLCAAEL